MKKLSLILILLLLPITVNAKSGNLYDVFKNEAESNGLAREYTGEHHDSFTEEPTHKIYHWYADNSDEGLQVLEKNNVIFANHCWQMIRTTDTGGVKLIYNGEIENNKCLDTRGKHFGYSDYNSTNSSGNYYYGSSYRYDKENNVFYLSGDIFQSPCTVSNKDLLVGKFTCKKTTSDGTCSALYIVEDISNNNYARYSLLSKTAAEYFSIGYSTFNAKNGSFLTNLTYMHNIEYEYHSNKANYKDIYTDVQLSNNTYWVSDSIQIDSITKKYSLVNPYQVDSSQINSMKGKYTFVSTNANTTNTFVRYVVYNNSAKLFSIVLNSGKTLEEENFDITYGNTYEENNDGTFTINNKTTIKRTEWINNYNQISEKYLCLNNSNGTCEDLMYAGETNLMAFYYLLVKNKKIFSNDVTYQDGHYVLGNDRITVWNYADTNIIDSLANYHYTCWNDNGVCDEVSYLYTSDMYHYGDNKIIYLILSDGQKIDSYLSSLLYDDNVNQKNSTIKNKVDIWYEHYMTNYTKYLEDVIYCNNRNITNMAGLNPNGGSIKNSIEFGGGGLKCLKETGSFSISNSKAKLKYPVGLITYEEANILHDNTLRKETGGYWTMTPDKVRKEELAYFVYPSGSLTSLNARGSTTGIRPVISLKKGTRYESGTGTMEEPYVIDYNTYYSINVEVNNETEDLNIEIEDLSTVPEGEEVNFKITPIKGRKVTSIRIVDESNNEIDYTTTDNKNYTFTMPATDVTIIPSYERVKNSVNVEDNINTKEFIIEVNDAQAVVYEDTVRFRVEPEEGYEVETIEIIDEQNNKINYKKTNNINEYEFTMPDTNVLIKPKYKLIPSNNSNLPNPNTKRQLLLIFISIFIIGIITYKYKKKRLT